MFNDDFFDNWLHEEIERVQRNFKAGESLNADDKMLLILKAQTNHFHHLDIELRTEVKTLREDMDKRFEQVDKRFEQVDKRFEQMVEQMDKRFEQVVEKMDKRFEQVEKRFEQVEKRFEQVDKRFEQVDKRFELLITRIDHFMIWSFTTMLTTSGIIIAAIKLFP